MCYELAVTVNRYVPLVVIMAPYSAVHTLSDGSQGLYNAWVNISLMQQESIKVLFPLVGDIEWHARSLIITNQRVLLTDVVTDKDLSGLTQQLLVY